jgi:hypothetical protein
VISPKGEAAFPRGFRGHLSNESIPFQRHERSAAGQEPSLPASRELMLGQQRAGASSGQHPLDLDGIHF